MNCEKKYFLLLVLLFFIGLPENGYSFENYNAVVTANINLRSLPGLNSKIITGINGGEKVLVKEKSGDWCQIVIEKENYGFKGWVYGEYLNRIEPEIRQLAAGQKKKAVMPILQTATQINQSEVQGKKPSFIQDNAHLSANMTNQTPVVKKVTYKAPVVKKADEIVEIKDTVAGTPVEKHINTTNIPKPEHFTNFKQIRYPEKNFSPLQENRKSAAHPSINIKPPSQYHTFADFVHLLLRLSTVLLSCLALMVSFKALKLAKS